MSKLADQQYLLSEQYQNASNLNARIQLHLRFSTNRYSWMRWVFDQLNLPARCRILELGCGPGRLWLDNLPRVPAGWDITLSDFSPGMLDEAKRNLAGSPHPFQFKVIDAQSIAFDDGQFDAVIANHMLYHVPDRDKAYAEIRRVLRPGGRFYATTNGRAHLQEIEDLVCSFYNPKAKAEWFREAGDLIQDILDSASDVLKSGSQVHFGVHPNPKVGLATPRLMRLTNEGYASFGAFRTSEI